MTVKECYEKMGSDYENVLLRLDSDAMIKRFALKFLEDLSYSNLKTALQVNDCGDAFRAAHTLKGVCQSLGFDRLFAVSSEITEMLRANNIDEAKAFFERVTALYDFTIEIIKELER